MRPAGMSSDSEDDDFEYGGPLLESKPKPLNAAVQSIIDRSAAHLLKGESKEVSSERLCRASGDGDLEIVRELIEAGVSPNHTGPGKWTPLMWACFNCHVEVVRFLLENKADPSLHKELFTPLLACCSAKVLDQEKATECTDLLLTWGANPNSCDKSHTTPLMMASKSGLADVVRRLLSCEGINIEAKDFEGWTALFYAVNNEHSTIVQILLQAGADAFIKDSRSQTVFDVAYIKGLTDILPVLGSEEILVTPDIYKEEDLVDPIEEIMSDLPDSTGSGGYTREVERFFNAVSLSHVFKHLNYVPDLHTFLNAADAELCELGVKYHMNRRKLLFKAIHHFHLRPWKSHSMYMLPEDRPLDIRDCVLLMGNMLRHLCVLRASLSYLKKRLLERQLTEPSVENRKKKGEEFVTLLVYIHKCLFVLKGRLLNLSKQFEKIDRAQIEADYVFDSPKPSKPSVGVKLVLSCAFLFFGTVYCIKFR